LPPWRFLSKMTFGATIRSFAARHRTARPTRRTARISSCQRNARPGQVHGDCPIRNYTSAEETRPSGRRRSAEGRPLHDVEACNVLLAYACDRRLGEGANGRHLTAFDPGSDAGFRAGALSTPCSGSPGASSARADGLAAQRQTALARSGSRLAALGRSIPRSRASPARGWLLRRRQRRSVPRPDLYEPSGRSICGSHQRARWSTPSRR